MRGGWERRELIQMLYSSPGGPKREMLYQAVVEAWQYSGNHKHLMPNLDTMMSECHGGLGPFFIWMTIRVRSADYVIAASKKEENLALKQFLAHLRAMAKNPFVGFKASEALIKNENFNHKTNYLAMFQLERVRMIRGGARIDNNHLEIAKKVLQAIVPDDNCEEEYGAIFLPSTAINAAINTQRALNSARGSNHKQTLGFVDLTRKQLEEEKHPRSFEGPRTVYLWWTYAIEEMVKSSYSEISAQRECRGMINDFEKGIVDEDVSAYIKSLRKKQNSGDWELAEENIGTAQEFYDQMYYMHSLLSGFINYPINPKKRFDKDLIRKMANKRMKDGFLKDKWGGEGQTKEMKEERRFAKYLLSNIVAGGVTAKLRYPVQPLLHDLSNLHPDEIVGDMIASADTSLLHAHTARERDTRMVPIILALIGIDLLAKISRLGATCQYKTGKKLKSQRGGGEKEVWPGVGQIPTNGLVVRLVRFFEIVQTGMKQSLGHLEGSKLKKLNIYDWCTSFLEVLRNKEAECLLQFDELLELCNGSIDWSDYKKCKNFESNVKKFIREFPEDKNKLKNEPVDHQIQNFFSLNNEEYQGLKKKYTSEFKSELMNEGAQEKDDISFAPVYLHRTYLGKSSEFCFKPLEPFCARNMAGDRVLEEMPRTRYQRGPGEVHATDRN